MPERSPRINTLDKLIGFLTRQEKAVSRCQIAYQTHIDFKSVCSILERLHSEGRIEEIETSNGIFYRIRGIT
jgi:uncharacterized protein HemY